MPGGVNEPLDAEKRDAILALLPEALDIAKRTYAFFKTLVPQASRDEARHFGNFPTLFLSLVSPRATLEHYDGILRSRTPQGNIVEDIGARRATTRD